MQHTVMLCSEGIQPHLCSAFATLGLVCPQQKANMLERIVSSLEVLSKELIAKTMRYLEKAFSGSGTITSTRRWIEAVAKESLRLVRNLCTGRVDVS